MNVLISGRQGYIASHLAEALRGGGHSCGTVSIRCGLPDFTGCDAVIHCAALVHSNERDEQKFHEINMGMTVNLAEKARDQNVTRFIFMSTMAVYGVSSSMRGKAVIHKGDPENPVTLYGKSKLMAERALREMANGRFRVYILRLPMVYGDGAPGNYARLCQLVGMAPVFPLVENERSMISIGGLEKYVCSLLGNDVGVGLDGDECASIHLPQDPQYICTSEMAGNIARGLGKKIHLSPLLGHLVRLFPIPPVLKLFGNLTYARDED